MQKIEIKENKDLLSQAKVYLADPQRTLEWFGGVNYENLQITLSGIKRLMLAGPESEIQLMINSCGGATGIGMSFYDTIRSVLKPKLTTVGSGDVDSSGVIIFLAGQKRYLTKNTTLLFHLAGRVFDQTKRFTILDMENMLKEDRLKDFQYASVVSDATGGKYSPTKILELMKENTIITAEEAVTMGLSHKVLD